MPTTNRKGHIRILTLNGKFRLQYRKFKWLPWSNIHPCGKSYHPEQMSHAGHATVDSFSEAVTARERILGSPKRPDKWVVVP